MLSVGGKGYRFFPHAKAQRRKGELFVCSKGYRFFPLSKKILVVSYGKDAY